jgi:outer membrane lipoprotein-sorting protein
MRTCVLLAMAAGSLLAADQPNNKVTNDAETVFRTMEEQLTKAKALECVFHVKLGTESYDGSVSLAEGNRARVEINETRNGQPMRLLIVSDGNRLSFQDNGLDQPQLRDTPKHLNAEILVWLARPGVFLPQAPLPDVKADDAKDRFRVSGFSLGDPGEVDGREARQLDYQLAVKGLNDPFSVSLWLDLKSGLPTRRNGAGRSGEKDSDRGLREGHVGSEGGPREVRFTQVTGTPRDARGALPSAWSARTHPFAAIRPTAGDRRSARR